MTFCIVSVYSNYHIVRRGRDTSVRLVDGVDVIHAICLFVCFGALRICIMFRAI